MGHDPNWRMSEYAPGCALLILIGAGVGAALLVAVLLWVLS